MLSRRRSSEQTPPPSSPSFPRLSAALRNATILFSTVAHLDPSPPAPSPIAAAAASAHIPHPNPRQTDASGDLPVSEVSAMRRLFLRDKHPRPRRGIPTLTPDTRPPCHLVVAAPLRHRDTIRLYQLSDPAAARPIVHRSWPLSDLRKIDGLGAPLASATTFALYFATSPRPYVWRATTPHARAVFLWALLQTCVSRLRRAPPVANLRLLDLQKMAETAAPEPAPDVSTATDLPAASPAPPAETPGNHRRLTSSLEELAEHRAAARRSDASLGRSPHPVSKDEVCVPSETSAKALSGDLRAPPPGHDPDALRVSRPFETDGDRRSRGRVIREASMMQKVKRTLSEPKASAMHVTYADDSDMESGEEAPQKAETVAPGLLLSDPSHKDLSVEERAFLAAAKRMGTPKSLEQGKGGREDNLARSQGGDPKARFFQNRTKAGKAGDVKQPNVVVERMWQQEKKLFRLSPEEQKDLGFALEMFSEEGQNVPVHDFGSWTETKIQVLEIENVSDTVNVEKQSASHYAARGRGGEPPSEDHAKHVEDPELPYESLVESMMLAEPWLEKCQTLLGPYAELANDISEEVGLLELQQRNTAKLENLLVELIETLSFEYTEQSLVDGIASSGELFKLAEFDTEAFQNAVHVIAYKTAALQRLTGLSDMQAVREVQNLLWQRQEEASAILLPILKSYVDHLFQTPRETIPFGYLKRLQANVFDPESVAERQEFLTGVKSLFIFGNTRSAEGSDAGTNTSFLELLDHYVAVSSTWICHVIRLMMRRITQQMPLRGQSQQSHSEDRFERLSRAQSMAERLFLICVVEGSRALHLFRDALLSLSSNTHSQMMGILRRQVLEKDLVEEFLIGGKGTPSTQHLGSLLYASHCFDRFRDSIENRTDKSIKKLLECIDKAVSANRASRSTDPKAHVRTEEGGGSLIRLLGRQPDPVNDEQRSEQSSQPEPHSSTSSSPSGLEGSAIFRPVVFPSLPNTSGNHPEVWWTDIPRETILNTLTVCNDISLLCYSKVEKEVDAIVCSLEAPRDLNLQNERDTFLKSIVHAIDVCCEFTSPTCYEDGGLDGELRQEQRTKALCERIVAASMRTVECFAENCTGKFSDLVKLQNYSYIAAKLGEAKRPDFLVPIAHLTRRVRKHVVLGWIEREILEPAFGRLKLDARKRPAEAHSAFRVAVSDLNAPTVATQVKKTVTESLEAVVYPPVHVALFEDIVACVKERVEEVTVVARKHRVASDARAKLLSFSRELLSDLRNQIGQSRA